MLERIPRSLALGLILGLSAAGVLGGCSDSSGGGDPTPPEPPEVLQSSPENGAVQVAVQPGIVIIFSEPMDRASVEAATSFTGPGGARDDIPFHWNWMGTVFWIEPTNPLAYDSEHTVNIGTSARSADGVSLAEAWTLSFTTHVAWPEVLRHYPEVDDTGVALNANPWINFNQEMSEFATAAALSIDPPVAFDVTWLWDEQTHQATLDLGEDMTAETRYTITVSTAAQAANGETLPEEFSFSFTTGSATDDTPPAVDTWNPTSGSTNVPADIRTVGISFTEPVKPGTVNPMLIDTRFIMAMAGQDIDWNEDFSALTITLFDLPLGAEIFVDLGPFEDQAGNLSEDPPEWSVEIAGQVDWFPSNPHDVWTGFEYMVEDGGGREFPDFFEDRVEDFAGTNFSLSRYHVSYGRELTLASKNYYSKLSNAIRLRGFGEYTDYFPASQPIWIDQWFDPPVDWLRLPPVAGQSWSGSSVMDVGLGITGDLDYAVEMLGFEDLPFDFFGEGDGAPRFPFAGERQPPPMSAVTRDCAKLQLEYEIWADIPVGREVFEAIRLSSGVDTFWVAPGAGVLQVRSHSENYDGMGGYDEQVLHENITWWYVSP